MIGMCTRTILKSDWPVHIPRKAKKSLNNCYGVGVFNDPLGEMTPGQFALV